MGKRKMDEFIYADWEVVNTSTRLWPKIGVAQQTQITTILTKDSQGTYKCYRGDVNGQINENTLRWLCEYGIPLSYREALADFPGLKEEMYRK